MPLTITEVGGFTDMSIPISFAQALPNKGLNQNIQDEVGHHSDEDGDHVDA